MPQDEWTPRNRIEFEFRRQIQKLLDRYFRVPDTATLGQITQALADWSNLSNIFKEAALQIASRMATQLTVSNAKSWREAARVSSRGREIYESLRYEMRGPVGARVGEIVEENAQLISSIPEAIRESVNREILRLEQEGLRPEAIVQAVRERVPHLTRSRAKLIARTETSKAATALTRARSEDLGIQAYVWETSRDERVRPAHAMMQGVIVFWDDPPAPEKLAGIPSTLGHYGAGNCPNCRCDAWPLLRPESLRWPRKVYWQGQIRMMRLSKFRQLAT
jgi:SPP1 gp7 family putative phage head morphogenesis protein